MVPEAGGILSPVEMGRLVEIPSEDYGPARSYVFPGLLEEGADAFVPVALQMLH